MNIIDEKVLEMVAAIMGQHSAAAKTLADANERRARGQVVRFYQDGNTLFVVPVPQQPREQS